MKKYLFPLFALITLSFFLFSCSYTNTKDTVKQNSIDSSNDEEVTDDNSSKDISNDTALPKKIPRDCRLFFFDPTSMKLKYINKTIEVEDGAIIKALTKELQNSTYNDDFLTLTNKTSIKSANIDSATGVLKVVFSNDYTNLMTLGTSTESGLLSSLICTYGYNLGVDKVSIYFDDELYTSLRDKLPEGYFSVDYSFAEPYISSGKDKITSEDTIVNKTCRIFYYHCADNCYYYKDVTIPIKNNELITALTNELKKEIKDDASVLPESLYVKSATLDKEKDLLTVDLSNEYYDVVSNLGSSIEAGILDSIKFTYCYNYDVNNFILLVDGKPYSGSHITFKEGESIPVRYDDIEDYLKPLN